MLTCTWACTTRRPGTPRRRGEHLTTAVEKYPIGHYMWDVANVHLARMKKK